jgi:hypothetical protein
MSIVALKSWSVLTQVLHWAGCLLGSAVVLLLAVFAVGEGLPPLAALNASFAAVGMMLVGFLLIWWKDWFGALLSLAGLAWFQAIEVAVNGQPSGGLFPLFVVPGVLALLAGLMRAMSKPAMS